MRLKKEIEEDTNKWKHIHDRGWEELTSLKSMPPKAIYRFNAILIKIPVIYFTELDKIFQKFILTHKRPCRTIAILKK